LSLRSKYIERNEKKYLSRGTHYGKYKIFDSQLAKEGEKFTSSEFSLARTLLAEINNTNFHSAEELKVSAEWFTKRYFNEIDFLTDTSPLTKNEFEKKFDGLKKVYFNEGPSSSDVKRWAENAFLFSDLETAVLLDVKKDIGLFRPDDISKELENLIKTIQEKKPRWQDYSKEYERLLVVYKTLKKFGDVRHVNSLLSEIKELDIPEIDSGFRLLVPQDEPINHSEQKAVAIYEPKGSQVMELMELPRAAGFMELSGHMRDQLDELKEENSNTFSGEVSDATSTQNRNRIIQKLRYLGTIAERMNVEKLAEQTAIAHELIMDVALSRIPDYNQLIKTTMLVDIIHDVTNKNFDRATRIEHPEQNPLLKNSYSIYQSKAQHLSQYEASFNAEDMYEFVYVLENLIHIINIKQEDQREILRAAVCQQSFFDAFRAHFHEREIPVPGPAADWNKVILDNQLKIEEISMLAYLISKEKAIKHQQDNMPSYQEVQLYSESLETVLKQQYPNDYPDMPPGQRASNILKDQNKVVTVTISKARNIIYVKKTNHPIKGMTIEAKTPEELGQNLAQYYFLLKMSKPYVDGIKILTDPRKSEKISLDDKLIIKYTCKNHFKELQKQKSQKII